MDASRIGEGFEFLASAACVVFVLAIVGGFAFGCCLTGAIVAIVFGLGG